MRLIPKRVEVRAAASGDIEVDWGIDDGVLTWSIAVRGDVPVSVEAVAIVLRLDAVVEPLRMFRHGYQSWSPSSVATYGVDRDPSLTPGVPSIVVEMHHADGAPADEGELRAEVVTALRDASGSLVVAGFLDGADHDGTFRLRPDPDGDGVALAVEAYLGGAVLESGEHRVLHPVRFEWGEGDPSPLLEAWASESGAAAHARVDAPYQVGWCSWYYYFWSVTQADVAANLARARRWPFDVFQVDDGYQAAIGDWLETNDDFPAGVDGLASAIAAEGHTPGIWIAPFVAGPGARVATAHADWFARHRASGQPLAGMVNEGWIPFGADERGIVHTLDTTNAEVLAHLEATAASLVASGFTYLKLDFTYAPSRRGVYADPSRTPAQRVRAGYDAIRRGAGDDTFILGCGAPIGAVIGCVDGMRIGADVAPWWDTASGSRGPSGYEGSVPATVNAWRNTLTRAFMHRRLWLNDPDCLMLRATSTQLSERAIDAWAMAVGMSGGMALVSDDLALLGADERALLSRVIELGRASDDTARAHADANPPRCPDLLERATPHRLLAAGAELIGDPEHAEAVLQPRLG